MSQSSPEGISLGKGSKLVSLDLSIQETKVLTIKKNSIEESAESIYPNNGYQDEMYCDLGEYSRKLFIEGAEWQKKQIFDSIKEYDEYIRDHFDPEFSNISFEEWFNNIKK